MKNYIFTSESVSEGHPDKVCDRISDSIVDLFLSHDAEARIAAETMAFTNTIVIAGEIRTINEIGNDQIEDVAKQAIKDIGYAQDGFHHDTVDVQVKLVKQSPDIAQGVDASDEKDEGAGDQGIMFGYACRETDVLMPAPIHYSHAVLKRLADLRHDGTLSMLGPDAKSQVSVAYENGLPAYIQSVVLSTQHDDGLSQADISNIIKPVLNDTLPDGWLSDDTEYFINPTGRFVIGGPVGDCGLTGRKIIVDTYGGAAPHGGGAFSGKDPTKVDRSAAYAARYIAKNIVAADLADKCTIQLSYAIGVSKPISVYVDTHDTGKVDGKLLSAAIQKSFDLTPRGIRTHLGLNKPIYTPSSSYGHFGRYPTSEGHFSWERTDLIDTLNNNL